ncbi:hypothetical protein Pmani_006717 [Petrolisthes manimaculis]|uniref:PHD-type domain-containing protein n=1 Tax=Petrolisthes manimaculis TaxID=1843537 RepID=A0AAE1QC12_9EUCA|nr:hypothetical protein Pmani_006717 [Petrolisthes manimaculis]
MPAKYPCTVCKKSCKDSQQCLQCDNCNRWQHRTCNTGISEDYYHQLSQMDDFPWNCSNCSPNTSDSTLPSQGPDAESTRLQASTAANSNYNVGNTDISMDEVQSQQDIREISCMRGSDS